MSIKIVLAVVAVSSIAISTNTMARKYSHAETRHAIDLYYGEVIEIKRAEIKSRAAQGAMIGGVAGLAYGSHRDHHRTQKAVEGAIAGALVAALIDRHKKKAREYHIRMLDGGTINVVSEEKDIREGDCVQVDDARRVNIRRVSTAYCEDEELDHHSIQHARGRASSCDTAKELLLDAETDDEARAAERKVRVLCD
ncbi:MAG: glycine zipper domain-containing protein [Gammaproteobacteria bacterium]|jgi:outer membrane lipoprotein SlyB